MSQILNADAQLLMDGDANTCNTLAERVALARQTHPSGKALIVLDC